MLLNKLFHKNQNDPAMKKAIEQVATEFERAFTSINKFNASVEEGAEQTSSSTITLKKKLIDLKKTLVAIVSTSVFPPNYVITLITSLAPLSLRDHI